MSMEVSHAVPSVRGEAAAGGHAARHPHALLHALLHAPHTRTVTKDRPRCARTQRRAPTHHIRATPPSWDRSAASCACGIVSHLRPVNIVTALCTPPPHSSPAP
eukprot:scaffold29147_cov63-Phaeocystis_antarctica.AAC.2